MPGKSLDNEMVTYLFIIITGFAHHLLADQLYI